MSRPDLNLLVTLDVLLAEGSVARAAKRLSLSPSAMSRALARLRETTGDPLLVRAGRGLVPTPRAVALREHVRKLVQEAESALRPVETIDLKRIERTFTLRNRGGFVENFGAALIVRVEQQAPGVRLVFVPKLDKENTAPLRDGSVDLETGVVGGVTGPEVRVQALYRDHEVGVVQMGHPLCGVAITTQDFAKGRHILVSHGGMARSPVDDALQLIGIERKIAATVGGCSEALALLRGSDLIATVPERYTQNLRDGLHTFPLPFSLPDFTVSMLWHPRMDADPVHRWLRGCIRDVCTAAPDVGQVLLLAQPDLSLVQEGAAADEANSSRSKGRDRRR
jgi:DNA-binding transcriptional LysR family regulator